MKNQLFDYLEKLDVTENEANLYMKLLETGPLDVKSLSQILETKRTTIYNYVTNLIDKGLISKSIYKSRTLLGANAPDEILPYLVEQKIQDGRAMRDELPAMIKKLNTSFNHNETINQAEIKFYKGKLGVQKIYKEALAANELRSYVNIAIMYDYIPSNSLLFANALKNNTHLKMYELIEDSVISREQVAFQKENAKHERYFYKFLPKDVKLTAADTLIYDGNVAIINVGKEISGVVFQNTDHYKNSKSLFDSYWSMLPTIQNTL